MATYLQMNTTNYLDIADRFNGGDGKLLLCDYSDCRRDRRKAILLSDGGVDAEDFPHMWLKFRQGSRDNREYEVRRAPANKIAPSDEYEAIWASAKRFFKSLKVGGYELTINPTDLIGCGFMCSEDGSMLYVPGGESPRDAIESVIGRAIPDVGIISLRPGESISVADVVKATEIMAEYIMRDLETGEIMDHNARAAMAADSLLGL